MQVIKHSSDFEYIDPLFKAIDTLYAFTSVREQNSPLFSSVFSGLFCPVFNLFTVYGNCHYKYEVEPYRGKNGLNLGTYDPKNIIVCISGGKDSFATAYHYKKTGWNVYLYHVKGLNQTYKDEHLAAKRVADYLQLPLIQEEVSYSGSHEWTEHPLKNWIFGYMAINWGIRNGIGYKIATGNFKTSSLRVDPFDVCGGDCREMWEAFEKVVQSIIPDFKVYQPNKNYQTALNLLVKDPEALKVVQSCIGPYRYREYLHKNNSKKYGIELLPHRCGSCWKCCAEYIYFTDHNVLEYNEGFYQHCLEVLCETKKKETGIKLEPLEIWDEYMLYPISKSKHLHLLES